MKAPAMRTVAYPPLVEPDPHEAGRVRLWVELRYASLTPTEAHEIARALQAAAKQVEQEGDPVEF